jgi:hypothetical protein
MNHSQRVLAVCIVLVCSVANAQDTYIRIYNGVNPYWGWPNNSLSVDQYQGYSQGYYYGGPVYRYYYYDPWPWDDRSRAEYNSKLEYRRELYSQRRYDQEESRYRTRARINARTGYVPQGPYLYSER